MMKITYYKETDTLYISLSDDAGSDSKEVHPGVVVDFNAAGIPIGIEIDNAKKNNINFTESDINSIPFFITPRSIEDSLNR